MQAPIIQHEKNADDTFGDRAMLRRKVEITVETDRIWVIRGNQSRLVDCAGCGDQVRMVDSMRAAALVRESPRQIFKWIESGQLHYAETPDLQVFVCLNSLLARGHDEATSLVALGPADRRA
jgi:hypothetical protein